MFILHYITIPYMEFCIVVQPNNAVAGVNLSDGLTGFDMVGARNNLEFQRKIAIKSHLKRK